MKNSKIRKKLYAKQREAKKYRKIKESPKKLNFGASKPRVGGGGGGAGPRAPPPDPHLSHQLAFLDSSLNFCLEIGH